MTTTSRNWTEIFEANSCAPASRVTRRVWRDVFGAEYPEGVEPFSYISNSELARFSREVRLAAGDHLVDLGCGRGGPGLWVAAHTGAELTGIDISNNALAAARQRARSLGLDARAKFMKGSFQSIPLADDAADAVMSVDAFLFAPDKRQALIEIARVLKPSGRLVMTTCDYHSQPSGRPTQVDDHRPLLEAAGFAVDVYEETEQWRERLARTGMGLLAAVDELAEESGEDKASVRAGLEEMNATVATILRRVLVAASRL